MSEIFFGGIRSKMSEPEKLSNLIKGWNLYVEGVNHRFQIWEETGSKDSQPKDPELASEDEQVIRSCIKDASPEVRNEAFRILQQCGPVTWDDIEMWLMSPDREVRWQTVMSIGLGECTPVGWICGCDKERSANLLAESWRRHPEDTTSIEITMLAMEEEGWLEPTWSAMEKLLDIDDEHIRSRLTVGYFEDMVRHFQMGPDDPHIKPWIEGEDWTRKCVLLQIAAWFGLRWDFLCDIVEALADNPDQEVAEPARQLLQWKNEQEALEK